MDLPRRPHGIGPEWWRSRGVGALRRAWLRGAGDAEPGGADAVGSDPMPRAPLQNRVDPWGRLNAVRARGTLMGNRGILHDDAGRIVRPWKGKAWIACALHWKDWQRTPFTPGTWSELFFLDEATAFAAGHRPCKLCRRVRHLEFKRAWLAANRELVDSDEPPISAIDAV